MVYSRPVASFIGDEASDEVTPKDTQAFQPLGITEIGSIRRNLVCEAIQFFRDAAQSLFDVPLRAVWPGAVQGPELMPAWHAGRDVLTETIRRIDVERGATGELNCIFGLKLVDLLKERLPDIGNGHLTFNSDFHKNNLM
jgi:hypothetical protein